MKMSFSDLSRKTLILPLSHLVIALVIGLAIGSTLPALAQQSNTVDPKIDQQIRMLPIKYDAAINKHDPGTSVSHNIS